MKLYNTKSVDITQLNDLHVEPAVSDVSTTNASEDVFMTGELSHDKAKQNKQCFCGRLR